MLSDNLFVIIGCEGFIGRNLLSRLSVDGRVEVLGIDKTLKVVPLPDHIKKLEMDVLDCHESSIRLSSFFKDKEYQRISIVHLAADPNVSHGTEAFDFNIKSLENVCQVFDRWGITKIIFASSGLVYGARQKGEISESALLNPESDYAKSKIRAEEYLLKNFADEAVILRLSNLYGPAATKSTVLSTIIEQLKNNCLQLQEYTSIRDFLYIKDAVRAFESALFNSTHFNTYNVASSKGHSIYECCAIAARVLHKESLLPLIEYQAIADNSLVLSTDRIKKDLGWNAKYTLEKGISEMVSSYG